MPVYNMQTNQWRMDYVRPPYYDPDDDNDSDDEENHYDYDYPSDNESEPETPRYHPITKNVSKRATESPTPPETPQQRAKKTRAEILKILGRK